MSLCKSCKEPVVFLVEHEELPDDLELRCGCHFHWQCLLDQSSEIAISLNCPGCSTYLPTNEGGSSTTNPFFPAPAGTAILTKFTNEGGVEENLDILPSLTEETYLQAHPEAQSARAMHILCSEGDVSGIVELLQNVSDVIGDLGSFIRYQDPLDDMKSALHLAIEGVQEETFWLLLWLSSTLPVEGFPREVRQAAEQMGISRLQVTPEEDIRGLRNSQGQSAKDLAQEIQGPWSAVLESGLL